MNNGTVAILQAWELITAGDTALWRIVGRSLGVSATACLLGGALGLVCGAWLGTARFRGRGGVLVLLNTLLAVPSVVVGLVVYLLLSRSGPLGHLGWLFSFKAMVLAQALLVWPVVTALVRQTIEDCLCFGARLAARRLTEFYDARLAPHGVNLPQLGLLAAIGAMRDGSISDIARRV